MWLVSAALLSLTSQAESIFTCSNAQGRPVYTDDARKCGREPSQQIDIELHNIHSQFGQTESKEYYNYANRAHQQLTGFQLDIWAESELVKKHSAQLHAAATRLQKMVGQALALLPAQHRPLFDPIRYYFFTGSQSSYGGKDSGLWYFPTNNRISRRFDNAIVINSAANYLAMSDSRALAVTLHELAHAFNRYHWREIARPQKAAYANAVNQKLYRNLTTQKGNTITKAYALTNYREYFAELSVLFFAYHYAYPHNRQGLAAYDPKGYALMQRAWLTQRDEMRVSPTGD